MQTVFMVQIDGLIAVRTMPADRAPEVRAEAAARAVRRLRPHPLPGVKTRPGHALDRLPPAGRRRRVTRRRAPV